MDNIDFTKISLPLSSEDYKMLSRAAWKDKAFLKDLPKDLKDEYNRYNWARIEEERQEMLRTGEMGQDD